MKNTLIKIFAGLAYVAMVIVNSLANILPINGRTTGAVSNAYPNLFAPAGPAFSIWGLIYLLLGGYVVYQFVKKDQKTEELLQKINPLRILLFIKLALRWLQNVTNCELSERIGQLKSCNKLLK